MKAWKEVTEMAIKHRTKHHAECCMDLENLRMMPTVTRYRIKFLSTTYADSDVMPAESSPKSNAKANSAQDQNLAWWDGTHRTQNYCGGYGIPNSRRWKPNQESSSTKREMHTCYACMKEWNRYRYVWTIKSQGIHRGNRYQKWASPKTRHSAYAVR